MPCSAIHALSGDMHPPRFLRGTVRMRRIYARGASISGRSMPHRRPPYDVSGSVNSGCLPVDQSNVPLSITIPPIAVPWPPVHFVRE